MASLVLVACAFCVGAVDPTIEVKKTELIKMMSDGLGFRVLIRLSS